MLRFSKKNNASSGRVDSTEVHLTEDDMLKVIFNDDKLTAEDLICFLQFMNSIKSLEMICSHQNAKDVVLNAVAKRLAYIKSSAYVAAEDLTTLRKILGEERFKGVGEIPRIDRLNPMKDVKFNVKLPGDIQRKVTGKEMLNALTKDKANSIKEIIESLSLNHTCYEAEILAAIFADHCAMPSDLIELMSFDSASTSEILAAISQHPNFTVEVRDGLINRIRGSNFLNTTTNRDESLSVLAGIVDEVQPLNLIAGCFNAGEKTIKVVAARSAYVVRLDTAACSAELEQLLVYADSSGRSAIKKHSNWVGAEITTDTDSNSSTTSDLDESESVAQVKDGRRSPRFAA